MTTQQATIEQIEQEKARAYEAYLRHDMNILDGLTLTSEQPEGKFYELWTATDANGNVVFNGSADSAENVATLMWWGRVLRLESDLAIARNGGRPEEARTPSSQSSEGMIIAALDRGVDVEAQLAAWNEDELSEDEDW